MFQEIKNRDAWATIRGYVYQVDTTLLRWLGLNDNELLELERGEDIDIIQQSISGEETSRLLDQIKFRESNITLNNTSVIETIVNFITHRDSNPGMNLFFRFVTNSGYGIERPEIFTGGKSGIEKWIELSSKNEEEVKDELLVLKDHLLKKIIEIYGNDDDKISAEVKSSIDFLTVCSTSDLFELVSSFEWSLENDDEKQISSRVKDLLIEKGIAAEEATEKVYALLFLYLFKLLSGKGIKRLSKTDLDEQIKRGISATDQRLFGIINDLNNALKARLAELEKRVSGAETDITNIFSLIKNIDSSTEFNYQVNNLSLNPPSLIINGSKRIEKVSTILNYYKQRSWILLQGINGSGKSQLAAMVSQKFTSSFWLDLRPFTEDETKAGMVLHAFLKHISGREISNQSDMDHFARSLPDGTVLVVNDLFRTSPQSLQLNELLVLLNNSFSKTGAKLLTTSNYPIHQSIKERLIHDSFLEISNLEFSDQEIIEYFHNNGAPELVLNFLNVITVVTARNPRLISAILRRLKTINWGQNSNEVINEMFGKEFTEEILNDVQVSIRKFITDVESKELLYRLSLINWSFGNQEIMHVSDVQKSIEHPNEKLADLVNIWIQQQGSEFQMSPLIHDIGKKNLHPDVINNTYVALGKSIMTKKKLDLLSASRAINQFIAGKAFDLASEVLIVVLNSAQEEDQLKTIKEWGYLDYWKTTSLPPEISISMRIHIRNHQLRIADALGLDTTFYLQELVTYSHNTDLDPHSKFTISLMLISQMARVDLDSFWFNFNNAFNTLNSFSPEEKERFLDHVNILSTGLWLPLQLLKTDEGIYQWIKSIESIEQTYSIDFFNNSIAQSAVTIITQNLINNNTDQNWQKVFSVLEYMLEVFKRRKKQVLEAAVTNEIIALTFVKIKNRSKGLDLFYEAFNRIDSTDARYLLSENIGKLLYDANEKEDASKWLLQAVQFNSTDQESFIDTLTYTAAAISKTDRIKAVECCIQALQLAKEKDFYSELDYIQLNGELAIAYWVNGDIKHSYECFEEIILRLFDVKEKVIDQKKWIRLFKLSAHALGYISAEVAGKSVPKIHGEEYFEPEQGFFSFNTKDLSDIYDSSDDPMAFVQLAEIAEIIGDLPKAYQHSIKAFDLARKNGNAKRIIMVAATCSQYSLINFKVEESLESYLLFSATSSFLQGQSLEEKYSNLKQETFDQLLKDKPSKAWDSAENASLVFAVIPMLIMVMTDYIENLPNKEQRLDEYLKMLKNYEQRASDPALWNLVEEMSRRIITGQMSQQEMINRGNTFGENNKQHEQIICILGMIFSTNDSQSAIKQMLNIMPYFTKTLDATASILHYSILPFVKSICVRLLANQDNSQEAKVRIGQIAPTEEHSIQKVLQIVIEYFKYTDFLADRKAWLVEYKQI